VIFRSAFIRCRHKKLGASAGVLIRPSRKKSAGVTARMGSGGVVLSAALRQISHDRPRRQFRFGAAAPHDMIRRAQRTFLSLRVQPSGRFR
jgi:hypothetical protein